jgi:uncharacterized protein with WD repeat
MELDITHMIKDRDNMIELSGSAMEHGENAGRITWNNSLEYAKERPLLKPDQIEHARDYFKEYGAWTEEEIKAWTIEEIQALAVQEVAARIREIMHVGTDSLGRLNWSKVRAEDTKGRISGGVYPCGGRHYFYMSH